MKSRYNVLLVQIKISSKRSRLLVLCAVESQIHKSTVHTFCIVKLLEEVWNTEETVTLTVCGGNINTNKLVSTKHLNIS